MAAPRHPLIQTPSRSMGLKLLLVCALALVMSIPALFVFMLLADRTNRAEQVAGEIAQLVGGPQTFVGPVLAVPYTQPAATAGEAAVRGVHLIFPESGQARVVTRTELRRRSLFKVPVYRADIEFSARFAPAPLRTPAGAILDWSSAEFLLGASDPRGAQADVALAANGATLPVAPAATVGELGMTAVAPSRGGRPVAGPDASRFFGASAAGIAGLEAPVDVTARLAFSGAQRMAVLAFAKTTSAHVSGDWPHPSFDGGFLPLRREVGSQGFTASWAVPFIARGVADQGPPEALSRLGQTALGVSFVEPANPYQSVSRSLKYALMFVGLVFLAYFLFETAQGRRVHPAQYVLIGLAQIIFYLLLLSIAERLGFDAAFLISAAATVGLISAYAGWVFESRRQGLVALVAFSLLYALIYVLMRLEDLALLVGAITSFAAIAAVMYFTRRIDWYGAAAPVSATSKDTENG